ncbi:hypothetical protein [Phaeovulum sp.]|uniref:hypothetical protein n=1 Tax=Phaeovulum sp. TaxID=2934796 RepID=UPI0035687823
MSSSFVPATPLNDLAAWAAQKPAQSGALLTPDLVALAQSGVSVTLASSTSAGQPIVGLGVGCRVRPDGTLRVLLARAANADLLAALKDGRPIAVTFTGAPDHRAFQVKAATAKIAEPLSDDLPEIDRQCAVLADGLVEIGFSRELAEGYVTYEPDDIAAVEFCPERVFTQTPGPGAGAELTR